MIIGPLPLPPLLIRLPLANLEAATVPVAATTLHRPPTLLAPMARVPQTGIWVVTTAVYNVGFPMYPLRPA